MTLRSSGKYDCSANLFWLKLTHLSQPGVPINEHSIEIIMETKFASPQPLLDQFVIRVPDVVMGEEIAKKFGALEVVSPPEVLRALVLKIQQRLSVAEEAELQKWRQVCLSVTFIFECLGSLEQAYWRAVNLREMVVSDFESLARDVTQRVHELVSYKSLVMRTSNKDLTNKELAAAWKDHVVQTDSKFSERVTENFVDTAMKVYHRLFCAAPESLDMIMEDCWVI